jgi:cobalamin biosynthetic protein CobC
MAVMTSMQSSSDRLTNHSIDERLRQLRHNLPLHGGDIETAAARYGIPLSNWIDLSTGMNPQSYPIPDIPVQAFQNLPYWRPDFLQAVENYYGYGIFVPVVGSQQAIQALPNMLINESHGDVLLPAVGYQEHAKQWRNSGASLAYYSSVSVSDMCQDIDASLASNAAQHLVVISPNNPTAIEIDNEILCAWAEKLAAGSYLIVDEAFIDVGHQSLLTIGILPSNIIILRSFGKFFGLAGIRLGFVFANQAIVKKLKTIFGTWQINGPAQAISTIAMNDVHWQKMTRQQILINATVMKNLLNPLAKHFNFKGVMSASLFFSYAMSIDLALTLNDVLAKLGLLTRVVIIDENNALLRFGSISSDNDSAVQRIQDAVKKLCSVDTVAALLDYQVDAN